MSNEDDSGPMFAVATSGPLKILVVTLMVMLLRTYAHALLPFTCEL